MTSKFMQGFKLKIKAFCSCPFRSRALFELKNIRGNYGITTLTGLSKIQLNGTGVGFFWA